ncbi:MAG: polyphosphate kinase 2 family protein [Bacteroidetes bacterium]|nr:polyphosphate kinase 2 family protein [Bacteroidota bacterium]
MAKLSFDYTKYRVPTDGAFSLASISPGDTQGLDEKKHKDKAKKILKKNQVRLDDLQERLYAESRQSVLLVLQAMDTAGKDSTIRKVVGDVNPQGCLVTSFKAPSKEERAHDFLWRIHEHAPPKGYIGIFNRSHYEDVLIVRVHGWASPDLIEKRYDHINAFEKMLADHGTRIVKVMLYVSKKYQLKRLRRRLRRPDKHWKFNPGDLKERKRWDDYMDAYEIVLQRCSTPYAPWYVVPAEQRWFRDLVISQLLVDTLEAMDPQFPEPSFNPADYPPESLT